MQRQTYTTELKEVALNKAINRGDRTLEAVATEVNIPLGTLKNWLKMAKREGTVGLDAWPLPSELASTQWTAALRLQALQESYALVGPQLAAWCREKGLFEHQLNTWAQEFCLGSAAPQASTHAELRALKREHEQLQRELRRKDKALAETAALLVLQKKFHALLEAQGE